MGFCGAAAFACLGILFSYHARAQSPAPRVAGTASRVNVTAGGRERSFVLYVPKSLKPHAPLLFVLHGSGGDGASMREVTGYEFDMLADAQGFLVVYPDGYEETWNDCRKASPHPARRMHIDDEGFIQAMIAKEALEHGADKGRVFAVGHSNGGQLAFRLALEQPERFAGVAAISAGLPTQENLDCTPSGKPIPVLIMNGTGDPINPYAGGKVMLGFTSLGTVLSTPASAEYFAKLDGRTAPPMVTRLAHKNTSDPTWVEESSWGAPGKPSVVLYAIHGGGHVVPQPYFEYPGILGRQTGDIDAPAAIWDFFSKLPSRS
jgi:polyhydroxybutyrate depolymerase